MLDLISEIEAFWVHINYY